MKILLVVDVQKDFIDGTLGSEAAQKALPAIQKYVEDFRNSTQLSKAVIFTQDYHTAIDNTVEMQQIPEHCIENTSGSAIMVPIAACEDIILKHDFMMDWYNAVEIEKLVAENNIANIPDEIEIIGYCTDICVISNALLLRKKCPKTQITILEDLCVGTSAEAHQAALTVAKSCLINVRKSNEEFI